MKLKIGNLWYIKYEYFIYYAYLQNKIKRDKFYDNYIRKKI